MNDPITKPQCKIIGKYPYNSSGNLDKKLTTKLFVFTKAFAPKTKRQLKR